MIEFLEAWGVAIVLAFGFVYLVVFPELLSKRKKRNNNKGDDTRG